MQEIHGYRRHFQGQALPTPRAESTLSTPQPTFTIQAEHLDAYMEHGEVPPHLRCPISHEALRNPVRLNTAATAYSHHALCAWFRHDNSLRDPLTQQAVRCGDLHQEREYSASLHELRLAAERRWRAAGEDEKAWAVRWLRLYCRRLELRPSSPLPPLVPAPPMTARQIDDTMAVVRRDLFLGTLAMARPNFEANRQEQNRYFYLLLVVVGLKGVLQLVDGNIPPVLFGAAETFLLARMGAAGTQFFVAGEGDRAEHAKVFVIGLALVLSIRHFGVVPNLPAEASLISQTASVLACLSGVGLGLARNQCQQLDDALVRLRAGE